MQPIDTDVFALDLLSVLRDVAGNPVSLTDLFERLFSGPQGEPEFLKLVRAVTRLRYLEIAILDALTSVSRLGPIEASEIYRDLSKSVIMAALVHTEEAAARMRSYYPHILSEADIERIRLTVRTGMNKGDLSKATEFLAEIQKRLGDRLTGK